MVPECSTRTQNSGVPQRPLRVSSQLEIPALILALLEGGHQFLNALAHNWDFNLSYAFLPFSLLSKVIMKVARSRGRFILMAQKNFVLPPPETGNGTAPDVANFSDLLLQHCLRHLDQIALTAWILNGGS